MNYTKEQIVKFLKDAVEWLKDEDMGCTTLKLDDRLAICVGWLPGYGKEHRDDAIQSKEEPDYAINAGIKVWTSDDMRTDYEFINAPYYKNGEVWMSDVSISPDDDYDEIADYLIKEYEGMKDLNIAEDGEILEDEKKEESCKKELNETFDGEDVIDDLVDRAQSMYDDGDYGDIDDCIRQAIDDGLIYTKDVYSLLEHYGSIDTGDIIMSYYDDLYNDIYGRIEEHEDLEAEEDEEDED